MDKKYHIERHTALVALRNKMVRENADKDVIKEIDRKIGHIAAIFNDKISAKATAWLETH